MNTQHQAQNAIQTEQKKYNVGRTNLLLVALFSLLNVFSLLSGNFTYLLFSAAIPYLLADFATFFSGRYPEEVYEGMNKRDYMLLGDGEYFLVLGMVNCQ